MTVLPLARVWEHDGRGRSPCQAYGEWFLMARNMTRRPLPSFEEKTWAATSGTWKATTNSVAPPLAKRASRERGQVKSERHLARASSSSRQGPVLHIRITRTRSARE